MHPQELICGTLWALQYEQPHEQGPPPATSLLPAHWERMGGGGRGRYASRPITGLQPLTWRNATFVKEGMPSCYRTYTSTKEGQHMHTGAYIVKLVLSCAALHSHAAIHSNIRKRTHPYLLSSQGPSSKHVFLPLILQHGLGLVGRSDEPPRTGGGRKGSTGWQGGRQHGLVVFNCFAGSRLELW